jgi:hypothetical protein
MRKVKVPKQVPWIVYTTFVVDLYDICKDSTSPRAQWELFLDPRSIDRLVGFSGEAAVRSTLFRPDAPSHPGLEAFIQSSALLEVERGFSE